MNKIGFFPVEELEKVQAHIPCIMATMEIVMK